MMMSLDPSSPEDHPTLRTEEQTQTSVGLSAYNVDRLKKLRANMEASDCSGEHAWGWPSRDLLA